ncbi:uncharacterized protein EI90DRAFT_625327 [Cantharellus anzutake]|uniref:uncharacterized protein n=1 Tax=Cantharellus anzutake TaxID=1750568 RepID=UPI00190855E4|nr:uncharacterized protein EI90DRAFT_625327 [Cantharellus anzutake]KAF8333091.1 hypothetical protein EI90DRAFT_625327 [Cantharellus anzutake]
MVPAAVTDYPNASYHVNAHSGRDDLPLRSNATADCLHSGPSQFSITLSSLAMDGFVLWRRGHYHFDKNVPSRLSAMSVFVSRSADRLPGTSPPTFLVRHPAVVTLLLSNYISGPVSCPLVPRSSSGACDRKVNVNRLESLHHLFSLFTSYRDSALFVISRSSADLSDDFPLLRSQILPGIPLPIILLCSAAWC